MKIIKPYTEILTPIDGEAILKHIELCGRVCYKSEAKIDPVSAVVFVNGIIKRGHESVLEHASITVRFVCDRGVSHEIVRHRIASYSQESTRYCNYGNEEHVTFILPSWFEDLYANSVRKLLGTHDLQDIYGVPHQQIDPSQNWFWACRSAELSYLQLLHDGWTPQEARSVLPNSLKTEVIMTANLREWRHFFKLRMAKAAHPQMRELTIPLLAELKNMIPVIFDDIEAE